MQESMLYILVCIVVLGVCLCSSGIGLLFYDLETTVTSFGTYTIPLLLTTCALGSSCIAGILYFHL